MNKDNVFTILYFLDSTNNNNSIDIALAYEDDFNTYLINKFTDFCFNISQTKNNCEFISYIHNYIHFFEKSQWLYIVNSNNQYFDIFHIAYSFINEEIISNFINYIPLNKRLIVFRNVNILAEAFISIADYEKIINNTILSWKEQQFCITENNHIIRKCSSYQDAIQALKNYIKFQYKNDSIQEKENYEYIVNENIILSIITTN